MENASKALIIAGAILLSILIISLGIVIFNQALGVINNNTMNEAEIATFNQKFIQYEGTNVKGSQINALLNAVIQNNVTYQDDTSKQVKLKGENLTDKDNWQSTLKSGICTMSSETGRAMTGKTYEVVCTMNNKTGLVEEVQIKGVK